MSGRIRKASRRDEPLYLYVIYDHPKDFPTKFIVRRWSVLNEPLPDAGCNAADTLLEARKLIPRGLVNLGRYPADDPCIAEVWV
jgi:hypothetical protein